MTNDKQAVRRAMRTTRDAFPPTPLPVPSAYLDRLTPATVVASYAPVGGEPDPAPLIAAARDRGCRIVLPHVVDRATALRFLDWDTQIALHDGPFGLRQPPSDAAAFAPDIILTPLVTFDRRGNRIGQGAGHYDRAFAEFPGAWRIGIAWSVQEVDAIDPDPWDVPLHAVLTEREWRTP